MNRPTLNDAMKLEAAKEVAKLVDRVTAKEIADCFQEYMDGFELAKKLERDIGCDLSFEDVEALDQMSSFATDVLLEAEQKWVSEFNIKPPYPMGTMTTKGVIDALYQYRPACYLVKPYGQDDGKTHSRRLVIKFEHVVLKEVAA